MQLRISEMLDEGSDQHSTLSLTDEWRSGSDNSFRAGDAHAVEEHRGELLDEELESAPVVEELHDGDEEDDGWDDTEKEPMPGDGFGRGEEGGAVGSKAKEGGGEKGDKVEDIVLLFIQT
jgi:hypothetical protein